MPSKKRSGRITSFDEFWPFYLKQHSKPATRWIHFMGTNLGLLVAASGLFLKNPWFLVLALAAGYAPAWLAHIFVEKNRPATFRYPLWSLAADFKMCFLLWRGWRPGK